jgi:hypothetical protein
MYNISYQNQGETLLNQIPLELVSNFLSIAILLFLGYKYLNYKKGVDLTKELKAKTDAKKITTEDIEVIRKHEREYKEQMLTDITNAKFVIPIFILIGGIIFIMVDLKEAMIHLNVIVVAFIYVQVMKIHSKNLYTFFYELRKLNVKDSM